MSKRRVFITGIGPITAFGLGIEPLWKALCDGTSAIKPIQRYDASGFSCRYGAEISDDLFNVKKIVPKSYRKATKVMARDIELAVGAAMAAVEDATLTTKGTDADAAPTINPDRFGCHIGAGLIATDVDELTSALVESCDDDGNFDIRHWGEQGMFNLTPLWLLKYLPNMLSCHVTIIHDCRGPSNTITCNEASSGLSLAESVRVIERDHADACLTGGAEYKLNIMGILRQHYAKRLATANGETDPTAIVRPFDPSASGSVLGEGGGILVLEESALAESRGATPYCEVTGFASTQSWNRDTVGVDIDPQDEGIFDAIELALEGAQIKPDAIDAIVPFGSGIPTCDAAEANAIRRVFGDRATSIPIVTTVPNVGNTCAGAGAIDLCIAAKMLREQTLPARLNTADAGGLDAVATKSRSATLENVLVMTPSMGGQNTAVVMKRI